MYSECDVGFSFAPLPGLPPPLPWRFVVDSMSFIVTCLSPRTTNQPYNCLCVEISIRLACNAVVTRHFPHGSEVLDVPRRLFRDKNKENATIYCEMAMTLFHSNVMHFKINDSPVAV